MKLGIARFECELGSEASLGAIRQMFTNSLRRFAIDHPKLFDFAQINRCCAQVCTACEHLAISSVAKHARDFEGSFAQGIFSVTVVNQNAVRCTGCDFLSTGGSERTQHETYSSKRA